MKRCGFAILFGIIALSLGVDTFAYPPDNAALIYYKYMVSFNRPDDSVWNALQDAVKKDSQPSEPVLAFLDEKQQLLAALQTASDIPNCDWGLDFSEGLSMEMPYLAEMKDFAYLLLAEARRQSRQEDPRQAMNLCLASLRMAGHVGDDTFISYLVGIAMSGLSYDVMEDLLSSMPPDAAFLTDLRRELKLPEYNVLEIKTPLLNESRYLADEILRVNEKKEEILKQLDCSEEIQKNLSLLVNGDREFLQRSADYYQNFFDQYMKILDQPYEKALQAFAALDDKPQEAFKAGKKEAFATVLFSPAVTKIYGHSIRFRTHTHALLTAIDLYRICAETEALPKELPADEPVDLFSGRPFRYDITDDGFVLCCNAKDRDKDTVQEYTFQIAK